MDVSLREVRLYDPEFLPTNTTEQPFDETIANTPLKTILAYYVFHFSINVTEEIGIGLS